MWITLWITAISTLTDVESFPLPVDKSVYNLTVKIKDRMRIKIKIVAIACFISVISST